MKTVKEWLEELPEPYRSQALKNTKEELLKIEEVSADQAVFGAFRWDKTPQGFQYWDSLFCKIKV